MARDFALPARVQGWARRPKRGETYGAAYVDPYYDTIATLYARGNVEKNSMVSPHQVLFAGCVGAAECFHCAGPEESQ